jgi:hypothetical protein
MLGLGRVGCAIFAILASGGGGVGYFIEEAYERRKR